MVTTAPQPACQTHGWAGVVFKLAPLLVPSQVWGYSNSGSGGVSEADWSGAAAAPAKNRPKPQAAAAGAAPKARNSGDGARARSSGDSIKARNSGDGAWGRNSGDSARGRSSGDGGVPRPVVDFCEVPLQALDLLLALSEAPSLRSIICAAGCIWPLLSLLLSSEVQLGVRAMCMLSSMVETQHGQDALGHETALDVLLRTLQVCIAVSWETCMAGDRSIYSIRTVFVTACRLLSSAFV